MKALTYRYFCFFLILALACISQPAIAAKSKKTHIPARPDVDRQVFDFAHLFTEEQLSRLEKRLSQHREETGNQIMVITEQKMAGGKAAVLESYCTELFNTWGIGEEYLNNGVLIYVAVKDRKARIEVGDGLLYYLPNEFTEEVMQNRMLPYFKDSNFFDGIDWGALLLIKEYNDRKFQETAPPQTFDKPVPVKKSEYHPVQKKAKTFFGAIGDFFWGIFLWIVKHLLLIIFGIIFIFSGGTYTGYRRRRRRDHSFSRRHNHNYRTYTRSGSSSTVGTYSRSYSSASGTSSGGGASGSFSDRGGHSSGGGASGSW